MSLPKFTRDMSQEEWETFKELAKSHMVALKMESPEQKLGYLTACGGSDMVQLLKVLEPENPPNVGLGVSLINDEYGIAVSKLNEYFDRTTNTVGGRFDFNNLKQKPGERIKDFEVRIRLAAQKCSFDDGESRIKEQLIQGSSDRSVVIKSMKNKSLTLKELLEIGTMNESYKINLEPKANLEAKSEIMSVNLVTKKPSRKREALNESTSGKRAKVTCYNCHTEGHFARDCRRSRGICRRCPGQHHLFMRCPLVKCYECNQMGHMKPVCPNLNRAKDENQVVAPVKSGVSQAKGVAKTELIQYLNGLDTIEVLVGGVKITFVIDSGCLSNLVDKEAWAYLKAKDVVISEARQDSDKVFVSFGSKVPLKVIGRFKAKLTYKDKTYDEMFYLIEEADKCILGSETAKRMDVLRVETSQVNNVFEKYPF